MQDFNIKTPTSNLLTLPETKPKLGKDPFSLLSSNNCIPKQIPNTVANLSFTALLKTSQPTLSSANIPVPEDANFGRMSRQYL